MIRRMFRRCGHEPGALAPEDQTVVDAFRSMLAALRTSETWTPGRAQDVAAGRPVRRTCADPPGSTGPAG